MPEAKQIVYTHKELTELMLKDQGLRLGHWAIFVRFRLMGANMGTEGRGLKPAAITFVEEIGIQEVDQPNELSVDASKLSRRVSRHSRKSSASA
jgi:hypothetical protein